VSDKIENHKNFDKKTKKKKKLKVKKPNWKHYIYKLELKG
jgi:hypothetical protein